MPCRSYDRLGVLRATNETANKPRPRITSDADSECVAGVIKPEAPVDNVTSDAPTVATEIVAKFSIRIRSRRNRNVIHLGKPHATLHTCKSARKCAARLDLWAGGVVRPGIEVRIGADFSRRDG
jgi:hypothetical protein